MGTQLLTDKGDSTHGTMDRSEQGADRLNLGVLMADDYSEKKDFLRSVLLMLGYHREHNSSGLDIYFYANRSMVIRVGINKPTRRFLRDRSHAGHHHIYINKVYTGSSKPKYWADAIDIDSITNPIEYFQYLIEDSTHGTK